MQKGPCRPLAFNLACMLFSPAGSATIAEAKKEAGAKGYTVVKPSVLSGADRRWAVSRNRAFVGYVLIDG